MNPLYTSDKLTHRDLGISHSVVCIKLTKPAQSMEGVMVHVGEGISLSLQVYAAPKRCLKGPGNSNHWY